MLPFIEFDLAIEVTVAVTTTIGISLAGLLAWLKRL